MGREREDRRWTKVSWGTMRRDRRGGRGEEVELR